MRADEPPNRPAEPSQPSQRAALIRAGAMLRDAGIPDATSQARRLLEAALGIEPADLLRRDPAEPLPAAAAEQLGALVRERVAGRPLQHLTGWAPFRGLRLAVGPGVFVPRPETELLVELALAAAPQARRVVDLGSGSGAIALSVAEALPDADVVAVERSPDALRWLRRNAAARAAAGARPIRIVAADMTAPDVAEDGQALGPLRGRVDLVIANPPYVPSAVAVPVEVRADPPEAVFSGADGLDAIRSLAPLALRLLRAGGVLALEHDETHQPQVRRILAGARLVGARFDAVGGHDDLAGRPRFVTAAATGTMLAGQPAPSASAPSASTQEGAAE